MRQGDELWAAQFPDLFREAYVGYADARVRYTTEGLVRLLGDPTNPADGERVVEVLDLGPEQAAELLEAHDPAHADVVRHARAMGLLGPG